MDNAEANRLCGEGHDQERVGHRRELHRGDIERGPMARERTGTDHHRSGTDVGLDRAGGTDPDHRADTQLGQFIQHDARRRPTHPARCTDHGCTRREVGDVALQSAVVGQQHCAGQAGRRDQARATRIPGKEHERRRGASRGANQLLRAEPDVILPLLCQRSYSLRSSEVSTPNAR